MTSHLAGHEVPGPVAARPAHRDFTRYLVPVGRALFVAIFLMAGPGHFSQGEIQAAAAQGVPLASLAVPLSGIIAIAGGLSVLVGFHARIGAWLLVLFLVPVTLAMHAFWAVTDPQQQMVHMIMFMKNVSMLGGALLVAHFGAGPVSIDERNERA